MNNILFWNDIALEANRQDHSRPPGEARSAAGPGHSARALALVHAAMADAYAHATRGAAGGEPAFTPAYILEPALPAEDVPPAAAAGGAAYAVLKAIYPQADLQTLFDEQLEVFRNELGGGTAVDAGIAFGQGLGQALFDVREDDGYKDASGTEVEHYVPGRLPGMHDVDPLNPEQGFYAFRWGNVKGFALSRAEVVETTAAPPPPLSHPDYIEDFLEVYNKGARVGGARSGLETETGLFWAYDGAKNIGTPPRLYNQIVVRVAEADGLDEAEWVRLLALVNVAMADAGVVAWHAKYLYNVWRPVIGIREHLPVGHSGAAHRDEEWVPLGAPNSNQPPDGGKDFTPPFPAYPSGHATFGAACFETLKRFRAGRGAADPDVIDIDVVSDELNGVTTDAGQSEPRVSEPVERHFSSIEEMIRQNLESRVFLGVHWRFDGVQGVASGRGIAGIVAGRLYGENPGAATTA
jgi:hypothetical protein